MCPLVFNSPNSGLPDSDEAQKDSSPETETSSRPSNSSTPSLFPDLNNGRITDRAELIERIKARNPNWITDRIDYYPNGLENISTSTDANDRPKSALHSGIFADDENNRQSFHNLSTSIGAPFHAVCNFRAPGSISKQLEPSVTAYNVATDSYPSKTRLRAPSLSSISSISNFVFKAPTSPLVHSSNPDHMETEPTSPRSGRPIDIGYGGPPILQSSSSSLQLSPTTVSPITSRHAFFNSGYKRRSMTDGWGEGPREININRPARRLSSGFGLSSELPFGSFVGSYEESILNGRMSTTPSKPLDFVAQIGVLGLGKCKPYLRCPAHLTIPFPAYFYSVGDYDSPSPYVGQIDLENVFLEKSSKKFPGYRIPPRGQLQIVIKNPNKTAVKLFLVPYDLRDMEPGSKTFVRQKLYAACSNILGDALVHSPTSKNYPPKTHEKNREALRYLIHLHICSPTRGRYYLHRNIRVVFANRVPDGKEKLRNEILLPNPKYSPWRPGRPESVSLGSSIGSIAGRRRSQSLMGAFVGDFCGKMATQNTGAEGVPPMPALPPQFADWNRMTGDVSNLSHHDTSHRSSAAGDDYGKIDASVYTTSPRTEAQGLLAKRLRGLEVDGFIDVDPRLAARESEQHLSTDDVSMPEAK